MWLVSLVAALIGFVSALLMGVTVVGVCRYGDRYPRFFERLKTLGALATIKEMARVYLKLINKFIGTNVGFKQEGVLPETKFFGLYLEHLLLIYWVIGTILVMSFRPVEPFGQNTNSLREAGAFFVLLSINVLSDAISLLWTKRCIALLAIPTVPVSLPRLLWILLQDILVAVALMFVVQFISNGLYAIQIGRPEQFMRYLLDPGTAFLLYAPVDPNFSHWRVPGQLFITCSTYLPSLLFYITCLIIVMLKPFYAALFALFDIFNIDVTRTRTRRRNCNQLNYLGSLAGIFAFAFVSIKFFLEAIR